MNTRVESLVRGVLRPVYEGFEEKLGLVAKEGYVHQAAESFRARGLLPIDRDEQRFLHIYDCDSCGGHGRQGPSWTELCWRCGGGGVERYLRGYPERPAELAAQSAGFFLMERAELLLQECFARSASLGCKPRGGLYWRGGSVRSSVRSMGELGALATRFVSEVPAVSEEPRALKSALRQRPELDADTIETVALHYDASLRWSAAEKAGKAPASANPFEPLLDVWTLGFAPFDWGLSDADGLLLPVPVSL